MIEEAHSNGARYHKACEVVGISLRTLQRWKRGELQDQRKGSKKRVVRKLSPEMKEEIITYLSENVEGIYFNGDFEKRLPHNLNFCISGPKFFEASFRLMWHIKQQLPDA